VEAEHVTHYYPGNPAVPAVPAVDDVSFFINEGETFGLVGESGSGKTTIGRIVMKLLNMRSGTARFDGADIGALKKREEMLRFRREAQMIFQDPYASLDPRKKVRDIVAEGIDIHRLASSQSEREDMVREHLAAVGLLSSAASRYPHEFSGGQRQRIGIARALALKPRFIVCDEPISALDVSIQAQIVNLLQKLQEEKKLTYLFIAHDLSMVRYLSNRIAVMCRGRLVELGPAEEVYRRPLHPYTQSLISAIPLPDPVIERNRARIPYEAAEEGDGYALRELEPGHFVRSDGAR
jgi:oligopeptide transport system ATP-binding protein